MSISDEHGWKSQHADCSVASGWFQLPWNGSCISCAPLGVPPGHVSAFAVIAVWQYCFLQLAPSQWHSFARIPHCAPSVRDSHIGRVQHWNLRSESGLFQSLPHGMCMSRTPRGVLPASHVSALAAITSWQFLWQHSFWNAAPGCSQLPPKGE